MRKDNVVKRLSAIEQSMHLQPRDLEYLVLEQVGEKFRCTPSGSPPPEDYTGQIVEYTRADLDRLAVEHPHLKAIVIFPLKQQWE